MFQQLSSTSKRIISKQVEIVNFPDNCCEKAVNFARKENISSPRRIHAKLKVLYSVVQWGQKISEVYTPFFTERIFCWETYSAVLSVNDLAVKDPTETLEQL